MRIKNFVAVLLFLLAFGTAKAQQKKYVIHTVAFYNFENLFRYHQRTKQ